ncbi:hypothetical protein [Pseudomonas syringae group genomosp. 7]|uniref:hypothetical protein n=1 Tax=Pseudomonas syringae group genomosp. 7 TaxID=251699 RepID=UPI0006D5E38B|nr:hypothetical protein [Pseudomonas syringae group genomosp. 7]UNB62687.1 hypothetical protein MME54_24385 [Pseudomonas syringae pv. helianthi]
MILKPLGKAMASPSVQRRMKASEASLWAERLWRLAPCIICINNNTVNAENEGRYAKYDKICQLAN